MELETHDDDDDDGGRRTQSRCQNATSCTDGKPAARNTKLKMCFINIVKVTTDKLVRTLSFSVIVLI